MKGDAKAKGVTNGDTKRKATLGRNRGVWNGRAKHNAKGMQNKVTT